MPFLHSRTSRQNGGWRHACRPSEYVGDAEALSEGAPNPWRPGEMRHKARPMSPMIQIRSRLP